MIHSINVVVQCSRWGPSWSRQEQDYPTSGYTLEQCQCNVFFSYWAMLTSSIHQWSEALKDQNLPELRWEPSFKKSACQLRASEDELDFEEELCFKMACVFLATKSTKSLDFSLVRIVLTPLVMKCLIIHWPAPSTTVSCDLFGALSCSFPRCYSNYI